VTDAAQSFDSFAVAYDEFTSIVDTPAWPWLSSLGVRGGPGSRALDAGCGGGRRTIELAADFDEVVGIDLSAPLVAIARERRAAPNARYEVADLTTFTDQGGGFDLVYSATALHHVDPLEPALEHLRSLVRPGGMAVLVDVVGGLQPWKHWLWRHGANRLTPLRDLPSYVSRFGWRDAVRAIRFETSTPWIRHLESDRFLTRAEFERRYLSVFPEGRIDFDHLPPALVWKHEG
jgi:SAM-dependent methyltransferase